MSIQTQDTTNIGKNVPYTQYKEGRMMVNTSFFIHVYAVKYFKIFYYTHTHVHTHT